MVLTQVEELNMKALAEMYRREALAKAAVYRNKAAAAQCEESKKAWGDMASVLENQAFIWECAAR